MTGQTETITYIGTLVPVTCYKCAVVFGMPEYMQKQRLNDHGDFYCPNGHAQHYTGPTEAEKLREQVRWANDRADRAVNRAATAEHRRRAEKAAKTRLKNRIAKGVCPCCQRSFVDVARHIQSQHPEFTEGES